MVDTHLDSLSRMLAVSIAISDSEASLERGPCVFGWFLALDVATLPTLPTFAAFTTLFGCTNRPGFAATAPGWLLFH